MATAKKTVKAQSQVLDEVSDTDVSTAAIAAAEEEQEVIKEKRSKARTSKLAQDSAQVYDKTLDDTAADRDDSQETEPKPAKATAKAGKRSAKALEAEAAQEAKEARKASDANPEADKPKPSHKPTRSRLERQGKKFRVSAELIEKGKAYDLEAAVALAQKTSPVKFDATVELHINLNVDPKHADQNVRDNLVLPAGSGKVVRIAVLTDDTATAKKAGADIAGNDDLLAQLEKGVIDFDTLIATPALMAKLGKYARMLGPRGLMPNPKSGTVTADITKAVGEARAGRVEYRVDSNGIVHLGLGKVSFTTAQLLENTQAVLASIKANKPSSLKGAYFKAAYLTTSMGPSIPISLISFN